MEKMNTSTIHHFIENHIPQMDSPKKVYQLFSGLGYKVLDLNFKAKEAWDLKEKHKKSVKTIYTIANYHKRFQVFLVEVKQLSPSIIRELPLYFEREAQYPFFLITSDYKNYTFVLVEKIREDVGVWKRKIIKLNLDRENAFYTDKWILSEIALKEGVDDPLKIYTILKQAFSVEKVSRAFFNDYKVIFFKVRSFLLNQGINVKQAHEFSQQLLNRIMFIYFIDKKRWLKHSPRFMRWFWNRYLKEKRKATTPENSFYERWLKILFLQAFNNRFSHHQYFPVDVRETLQLAPYLNGGLFKENELDNLPVNIPDEFIQTIISFFEKYNFTIREDLPLDVEVAVDPQMIGYVYESLANVAEEIYERQDLGIFYTPRIEVDFMCRRAILEYLSKMTDIPRDILYHLVFDEDKKKIERFLNLKYYEKLEEVLDNASILDPACGSGAFLVGMLNVLVELYKIIFKHLNRQMTDYELKKRIIGNNLYGVDVMRWAVHSAELRLWLSLMIESDLTIGDLKLYPLLPNLNLKLRVGDSLVQEIGGINLNLRDISISSSIKRKLYAIKREKEKFYNGDPTAKFKTEDAIVREELHIFQNILDERIINLKKKREALFLQKSEQLKMFEEEPSQRELFGEKSLRKIFQDEKKKINQEIEKLTAIKEKLKEQKPFIWDIDFAEIFSEKGGFDIVIGNPPYVRQEKIAPPDKLRSELTGEEKKEYKEKLLNSVQVHFPFIKSIDKKSDYYIYFYFHGLSLLNEKGTFCFITSNSWLDVGYGKDLQEFLLKYIPMIAIYDNQAKRSFEHADVNTIIALFNAPKLSEKRSLPALDNTVRFVMFKKPFEKVINTENLLVIEKAKDVISTDDFRVYPRRQKDLLEEGWEYPEKDTSKTLKSDKAVAEASSSYLVRDKFLVGKYKGDKWGGKYLRAPDIFFTILEKGKGKLVRLGDVADVRRGFTTGANEFFYIEDITDKIPRLEDLEIRNLRKFSDIERIKKEGLRLVKSKFGDYWLIEEEFLKPVVKSPREIKTIRIRPEDLHYRVFMCHFSKNDLKRQGKTYALEYINWGEKQDYHKRPTCRSRKRWWDLGESVAERIAFPERCRARFFIVHNPKGVFLNKSFYGVRIEDNELIIGLLMSHISQLSAEMVGRVPGGGGGPLDLDVVMVEQLFILHPLSLTTYQQRSIIRFFNQLVNREIKSIFEEVGINPKRPIREQDPNPLPDRKALDDVIFDVLGLTEKERKEVYWSVAELVKNRLEKARSV